MLRSYRRAVVVVACVGGLDSIVRLRRKRAGYVRKRVIRQPTCAVIVGLPRKHPVTRNSWVTIGAGRELAPVIPCRQQGATRAHRYVRLPLRTSRGIGVQLQRRAKSDATV